MSSRVPEIYFMPVEYSGSMIKNKSMVVDETVTMLHM